MTKPERPYTFRSRQQKPTEKLTGGPLKWRELREAAESFQAAGHSASTATVAENLFRTRPRRGTR